MKVLFDVDHGFAWAHGGVQVLVEHLMSSLPAEGIEVEPMRWWDPTQKGDILHVFYPPSAVVLHARRAGLKIVANVFLDYISSKGSLEIALKRLFIQGFTRAFGNYAYELGWRYPELCDACVYPSALESDLGSKLFAAHPARSHVILHGVEDVYIDTDSDLPRDGEYLVSVGTIQERKNSLLLARAAHRAGVSVVFVGKLYGDSEYVREFRRLVDGRCVIHREDVDEQAKISLLRRAKGFVLLSKGESGCIAALEALATGTPMLLGDRPWARSIYAGHAAFCRLGNDRTVAAELRRFFDSPLQAPGAFQVPTWDVVTRQYAEVYRGVAS
jgi:glycosyltransferase involved in cell wall biosynthesis